MRHIKSFIRRLTWAAAAAGALILFAPWLFRMGLNSSYTYPCGHTVKLTQKLSGRTHCCNRLRAFAYLDSLWGAAEGYRLEEGKYPSSLAILYDKGYLTPTFRQESDAYFKLSLGPDSTFVARLPDGTTVTFFPPRHYIIRTGNKVLQFNTKPPPGY